MTDAFRNSLADDLAGHLRVHGSVAEIMVLRRCPRCKAIDEGRTTTTPHKNQPGYSCDGDKRQKKMKGETDGLEQSKDCADGSDNEMKMDPEPEVASTESDDETLSYFAKLANDE